VTPALAAGRLTRRCDPAQFEFETTAELDGAAPSDLSTLPGQTRAAEALQLALDVARPGYNALVVGPPELGPIALIEQSLRARGRAAPPPDDWCYVHNFADAGKPRALRFACGAARAFKRDMAQLVEDLRTAIPAAFENDAYRNRVEQIDAEFEELEQKSFAELEKKASAQNIAVLRTPTGLTLAPLKDGTVMSPEDFNALSPEQREDLARRLASMQDEVAAMLRQVPSWRRARRDRIKALNEEVLLFAVGQTIDDVRARYAASAEVLSHLDAIRKDVVDNADDFRKPEAPNLAGALAAAEAPRLQRYEVNVIVGDHAPPQAPPHAPPEPGTPVVIEDHPTVHNLIGRVEYVAHFGALSTDFTLIRAGALHRANGGYLLVDAVQVLAQPFAWNALKRALKRRELRIESLAEMAGWSSAVSLEPQPIPLACKVILFCPPWLYPPLAAFDPEVPELFKVVVDLDEDARRNRDSEAGFARLIASLAQRNAVRPLRRDAVAAMFDHAARLADDAARLSLHTQTLAEVLVEADAAAARAGAGVAVLDASHVRAALDARRQRVSRPKDRLQEEIERGTLRIETSRQQVGQINGLSVYALGEAVFARPTRITATTRLGGGQVIDIQRESRLGGATHSKGVMILAAFLAARYCGQRPHALHASLVFEQTYGLVEGDSASLAELCALLSSLAGLPIKQALAVTGSVDQTGQVQAIGAVNDKIEGFFEVCAARGLDGTHGVLIPGANVQHLMLRDEVVEACAAGRFNVYAVDTVDAAIELLTGVPAGGSLPAQWPAGSVNGRVSARFAQLWQLQREGAAAAPAHARRVVRAPGSRSA
jgi:predicted ATP-dependent protease